MKPIIKTGDYIRITQYTDNVNNSGFIYITFVEGYFEHLWSYNDYHHHLRLWKDGKLSVVSINQTDDIEVIE